MKRIKIAYLSVNDPLDKRSWSGITYYLGQALQKHGAEIDFLGPVRIPRLLDMTLRAIAKTIRALTKKHYHPKYSLLLGWYSSRVLRKRMKGKHYDCVVVPAASTEFCFFRSSYPTVYVSDVTFELISDFYHDFRDISPISKWEGNYVERMSLQKSSLVILSSEWAKQSAVSYYKIDTNKVLVQPLGANMDFIPKREIIFQRENNPVLTMLYLGVDWERKGGAIAFDTLLQLHKKGIRAKLIICGCIPPVSYSHPDMQVIPFLNKNIKEDHEKFVSILTNSHFLLMPTRADCSLLVAGESSAYGMPAISTRIGGVAEVILDGVNGYCLPYEAGGDEYARLISEIFNDKKRYHELIYTSRLRFEDCLNWDKWAENFNLAFQERLAKTHSGKQLSAAN